MHSTIYCKRSYTEYIPDPTSLKDKGNFQKNQNHYSDKCYCFVREFALLSLVWSA